MLLDLFAVLWIISGITSLGAAFYCLACYSSKRGIKLALHAIETNTYRTIWLCLISALIRGCMILYSSFLR